MPCPKQNERGTSLPLSLPPPDLASVLPGGRYPSHANIQWSAGSPPQPQLGILFRTLSTGGGYHYKQYESWAELATALELLATNPQSFLAEFPIPKRASEPAPGGKLQITLADLGL